MKVLREEVVDHGTAQYFEVETWGELQFMPRNAQRVDAVFGGFTRTNQSTLLYTLYVEDNWQEHYDSEQDLINSCDSCYCDDLRYLKNGRIDIVEYRNHSA